MAKKFTEEEARAGLKYGEEGIKSKEDVSDKVLAQEGILGKLFRSIKVLNPLLDDFVAAIGLLKDFVCGDYPKVPWGTIVCLAGALLYVLSPLDLIPDFIPIIGFLDDAGVFALAIKVTHDELAVYKKWKLQQA